MKLKLPYKCWRREKRETPGERRKWARLCRENLYKPQLLAEASVSASLQWPLCPEEKCLKLLLSYDWWCEKYYQINEAMACIYRNEREREREDSCIERGEREAQRNLYCLAWQPQPIPLCTACAGLTLPFSHSWLCLWLSSLCIISLSYKYSSNVNGYLAEMSLCNQPIMSESMSQLSIGCICASCLCSYNSCLISSACLWLS